MKRLNLKHWRELILLKLLLFTTSVAFAAGGDLPFVEKTNALSTAIAGPFLTAIGTIMLVVTCIMAAFGEWGEGFKKVIQIVFWFSLALGVAGVITWLK